jgi:hypothetical protein
LQGQHGVIVLDSGLPRIVILFLGQDRIQVEEGGELQAIAAIRLSVEPDLRSGTDPERSAFLIDEDGLQSKVRGIDARKERGELQGASQGWLGAHHLHV